MKKIRTNNGAIIISPFCDNDCIFCGNTERVSDKKLQEIEIQVAANIKHHTDNSLDRLEISGCDPGEYGEISNLIKYLKHQGIRFVELATNGTRMKDLSFVKELKNSGLDLVKIPIYGHTAEIHEQISRKPGCFDEAISGINNAKEVGIKVSIGTTILKSNQDHVIDLYKFLLELVGDHNKIMFHPTNVVGNNDWSWHTHVKDLPNYIRPLDQWGLKNNFPVNFSEFPLCVFGYISNRFKLGGAPPQGTQQPKLKIEGELDTPAYREKKYHSICDKCVAKSRCPGFLKNDLDTFGVGNLKPIMELKLYN